MLLLLMEVFNINAKATWDTPAQDFMVTMASLDLSQVTSGHTEQKEHTLYLAFCNGWGDLKLEEIETVI